MPKLFIREAHHITLLKRLWLKWRTKTMHAFATFGCHLTTYQQSLWWRKLGRQDAICWLKKELSMVHLIFSFRNKTYLFVKIEIWNFQHFLDLFFRETSQNFSLIWQLLLHIEKCCLNVFLNKLRFFKVSQNPKSISDWQTK